MLSKTLMAEYYAFQAALLFSIAHVFVRRGLVHSNALTGSLISLGTSAAIFWLLAFVMVPWSTLWTPAIGYFAAAGVFAPAIGQTLGYIGMERIGVARASPIVNTSPIFSSIFAVRFLGEVWLLQNNLGTWPGYSRRYHTFVDQVGRRRLAKARCYLPRLRRGGVRNFHDPGENLAWLKCQPRCSPLP